MKNPETTQTPSNDNNDDNSNNEDNNAGWLTIMDKYVEIDDNGHVTSAFIIQDEDKNYSERKLEYDFTQDFGAEMFTTTTRTDTTIYVSANAPVVENGEFYINENGDSICKVITTKQFNTTNFSRTLTTVKFRGFTRINGQWEAYKDIEEASRFVSKTHTSSEITRNDSVFARESAVVTVVTTVKGKEFKKSATTHVDRFIKKVSNDENKDENNNGNVDEDKKEENTPNAIEIAGLQKFISWTKVFNNNNKTWEDALLFEASNAYYMLVNGKLSSVSKSEVAKSSKYNGVVFNNGSYLPAVITVDANGWTVVGERANGTLVSQTHSNQDAVSSGIKNFSETNNAKPSPFVKNVPSSKTINGKLYITVTGYTVDGKVIAAYTVAEK